MGNNSYCVLSAAGRQRKLLLALAVAVGAIFPAAAECFRREYGGKALFYFAEHAVEEGDPDLEFAVIWIHGKGGGSQDPAATLRKRLAATQERGRVYCIAPSFNTTGELKNPAMRSDTLLWDKENWRGGGRSSNGGGECSFAIIDDFCKTLSRRELYPRLKHILIAGFSAGGQFVNRYVAVGRLPVASEIRVSFAVGAPSSYLYVDKRRFDAGAFRTPSNPPPNFNRWRNGLESPPEYAKDIPQARIMKNLASRYTFYFCGELDTGKKNLDTSPATMPQGRNRRERFEIFRQYVELFPEWQAQTRFRIVPGCAHDKRKVIFESPEFLALVCGERPAAPQP